MPRIPPFAPAASHRASDPAAALGFWLLMPWPTALRYPSVHLSSLPWPVQFAPFHVPRALPKERMQPACPLAPKCCAEHKSGVLRSGPRGLQVGGRKQRGAPCPQGAGWRWPLALLLIHCSSMVFKVVFLLPQNRLQESMKLFSSVCNNVFFQSTSLVSPSKRHHKGAVQKPWLQRFRSQPPPAGGAVRNGAASSPLSPPCTVPASGGVRASCSTWQGWDGPAIPLLPLPEHSRLLLRGSWHCDETLGPLLAAWTPAPSLPGAATCN